MTHLLQATSYGQPDVPCRAPRELRQWKVMPSAKSKTL
jgi:hypothetical protein